MNRIPTTTTLHPLSGGAKKEKSPRWRVVSNRHCYTGVRCGALQTAGDPELLSMATRSDNGHWIASTSPQTFPPKNRGGGQRMQPSIHHRKQFVARRTRIQPAADKARPTLGIGQPSSSHTLPNHHGGIIIKSHLMAPQSSFLNKSGRQLEHVCNQ